MAYLSLCPRVNGPAELSIEGGQISGGAGHTHLIQMVIRKASRASRSRERGRHERAFSGEVWGTLILQNKQKNSPAAWRAEIQFRMTILLHLSKVH